MGRTECRGILDADRISKGRLIIRLKAFVKDLLNHLNLKRSHNVSQQQGMAAAVTLRHGHGISLGKLWQSEIHYDPLSSTHFIPASQRFTSIGQALGLIHEARQGEQLALADLVDLAELQL